MMKVCIGIILILSIIDILGDKTAFLGTFGPYLQKKLLVTTGLHHELLRNLLSLYDDTAIQRLPVNFNMFKKNVSVFPISFSIPESRIAAVVPAKTKAFCSVIPGNINTYNFTPRRGNCSLFPVCEHRYHSDMRSSLFSITFKKSGWDCLRHLEILAAGSFPWFPGIQYCPKHTMAAYPKRVLHALQRIPVVILNGSKFSHASYTYQKKHLHPELYHVMMSSLLFYTKDILSTKAMAKYVLDTMNARPKRILFLSPDRSAYGDYMCDTLLHGFKTLLGQHNVIDYHRRGALYKTFDILAQSDLSKRMSRLYGKGFSFAHSLNEIPFSVSREGLSSRIKTHEFDVVIIAMAESVRYKNNTRSKTPSSKRFVRVTTH